LSLPFLESQNHHTHLNLLSSLISSSTFLLPTRFSDSDATVELTCALSDVVSLVNDAVHYHSQTSQTGNGTTVQTGRDGGRRDVLVLRAAIAGLECVELAVEKLVSRKSAGARDKAIAVIEASKGACRVLLILSMAVNNEGGYHLLQRGGGIEPGVRGVGEVEVRAREGAWFGVTEKGRRTGHDIAVPNEELARGFRSRIEGMREGGGGGGGEGGKRGGEARAGAA